jgi:hypothetical protein
MRKYVALGSALVLAIAVASPVLAGRPVRGCSNEGFVPMSYAEFRQLSLDVGVPEELLGPAHRAHWQKIDKNGDDILCVKDLPDTKGHLGTWVFNVIDNTSNG